MMKKKDETTLVRMEKLCAAEYLITGGGTPRRVLECIWLRIKAGQVWGIYAPSHYEAGLLLEIMANVRPYEDGRCVLAERGMMRRKRVILPHVFYIGSTDMLYDTMNVLEYLMFATAKEKMKPAARQEKLFEWLIECGVGDMSLTQLRWLEPQEKAIVILMAAAYSKSSIVIFNLPRLEFDESSRRAFAKISERMKSHGKALILSTRDESLIQNACTHAAFLAKGKMIYQGTVDDLRMHFDIYTVLIEADADCETRLREAHMDYRFARKDEGLYISGQSRQTAQDIFRVILDAGILPVNMKVHSKEVKIALEELASRHDLS
jgi:ABC-2 type transport system ATP-binding protein